MTDTTIRYNKALEYVRELSRELADDLTAKTAGWDDARKDLLSLGGGAYWRLGSKEDHIAVRALLLCTVCYMRKPHANMDLVQAEQLKEIRDAMEGKPKAFVDQEIRLYCRDDRRSKDRLAQAAQDVCRAEGNVTAYSRTRAQTNVGTGPVCYNGTSTWLFAAGFVSRRWLAKEGSQMLDRTAREFLGEGALIGGREQWSTIPRGHIFHIHKTGDPNTCHWGVSLGEGRAVACNNTTQAPQRNPDASKVRLPPEPGKLVGLPIESNLKFEGTGNATYGIFDLAELCDILNRTTKYMVGTFVGDQISGDYVESNSPSGCNIVLRHIDPTTVAQWY
jgi:hypothetical protein